MHPRPFDYVRVDTVPEALSALAEAGPEARPIAGGQSLVPMMSLGLAVPDVLVDIGNLDLAGFERSNRSISVGALTRHREFERDGALIEQLPLAAEAARHIGNPRVRNRGTLGGSLSHADPAAELGAVALAHGGRVTIAGGEGERTAPIDDFFQGLFTTSVQPGELLTKVELDLPSAASGHGFWEVATRADDFAIAAAAAIVTVDDSGVCSAASLALAGIADRPMRLHDAEEMCAGEALAGDVLSEVARSVAAVVGPERDPSLAPGYRARVAGTCAARALQAGWRRARGEVEGDR